MRARGRLVTYSGRYEGAGIDDSLSGPATTALVFAGSAARISDPISFPWGSADPEHWRIPVLFDLSTCSGEDLTALLPVLSVATPHDRLFVGSDRVARDRIMEHLSIPESSVIETVPTDVEALLLSLVSDKLHHALLREVLTPIITGELGSVAGFGDDCRRPLRVIDVVSDHAGRRSFIPSPHEYVAVSDSGTLESESAHIFIVSADDVTDSLVEAGLKSLHPGGLIIVLLDGTNVNMAGNATFSSVLEAVEVITGPNRLVEHVWGLHSQPGRSVRGGVIAIRPLGRPQPPAARAKALTAK